MNPIESASSRCAHQGVVLEVIVASEFAAEWGGQPPALRECPFGRERGTPGFDGVIDPRRRFRR